MYVTLSNFKVVPVKLNIRFCTVVTGLKDLKDEDLAAVPFVQGLRPFRDGQQARVEADGGTVPGTVGKPTRDTKGNLHVDSLGNPKLSRGKLSRIVHAYGHGGSGFTLSFGSAMVAFSLLEHRVRKVRTAKGDPHIMLAC